LILLGHDLRAGVPYIRVDTEYTHPGDRQEEIKIKGVRSMKSLYVIARLLVAAIFVSGGWETAREPGSRPQAAASIGMPQPELAVRANALVMVLAGMALAFGIFPRWAAAALAGSLVPTTLAGHPFWKEQDPQKRKGQLTHFLKNLSMLGGLVFIAATHDSDDRR
jgi:putative oxidoreductase